MSCILSVLRKGRGGRRRKGLSGRRSQTRYRVRREMQACRLLWLVRGETAVHCHHAAGIIWLSKVQLVEQRLFLAVRDGTEMGQKCWAIAGVTSRTARYKDGALPHTGVNGVLPRMFIAGDMMQGFVVTCKACQMLRCFVLLVRLYWQTTPLLELRAGHERVASRQQ